MKLFEEDNQDTELRNNQHPVRACKAGKEEKEFNQ